MDLKYFRKQRDAEVLVDHVLDDDAFKQLIEEKFKRARAYHLAFQKQEELVTEDWLQTWYRERDPAPHAKHGATNVGGLPDGKSRAIT